MQYSCKARYFRSPSQSQPYHILFAIRLIRFSFSRSKTFFDLIIEENGDSLDTNTIEKIRKHLNSKPSQLLLYNQAIKKFYFSFRIIMIWTAAAIYWRRRLIVYILRKMLNEFTLEDLLDETGDRTCKSIGTAVGELPGIKLYRDCLTVAISGGNAKNHHVL